MGNLGSTGVTIYGAKKGDGIYYVASAGDVNNDGFGDVFVGGAPNIAYVIYGAASLPNTINLARLDPVAGVTFTTPISGASLRGAGAGDVNDDGIDDFIISTPTADPLGRDRAGESYVIFGSSAWPTTIDLGIPGSADVTIFGADAGDLLGIASDKAGDLNGDGIADLLVVASLAAGMGNLKPGSGESYVIFGRTDFRSPGLIVSVEDATTIEGSQLAFAVSISSASSVPVSVDFSTVNGTAFAGNDYVSTSSTLTFLPGDR